MTDQTPPVLNSNLAKASFGVLLVMSILWAAGGTISTLVQGLPFNWLLILGPLGLVILFQVILTWTAATIRMAVAEGLAMGFAIQDTVEHLKTNREKLN